MLNTLQSSAICEHFQPTFFGKMLGSITQTKPVRLFEKHINCYLMLYLAGCNEPASPEYQELGKEAQDALGIPLDQQVPLLKIPETHPLAPFVRGLAMPTAIYVNEKKLNESSYEVRRCALFHEATHKKYNDPAAASIIGWGTFFSAGYITHKLIQKIKTPESHNYLHAFGVILVGEIASTIVTMKYQKYMERRADIEGFYATQCYQCVQEMVALRHQQFEVENHPFKNNGYLWAHEIELIVQDLEAQGMLCPFHRHITQLPQAA